MEKNGKKKKSVEKEKSGKKWKSIKVDEDTHLLLKNLSTFLNINIGEVVAITTMFFYALLRGRNDIARKILQNLKNRYEKKKILIEYLEEKLNDFLKK